MFILSSIRKRSGLLIGIVAVALLSFVLSDLLSKRGNTSRSLIGEINGEEISYQDFSSRINEVKKDSKNLSSLELAKQTWEKVSEEIFVQAEMDKIGFSLSEEDISKAIFQRLSSLPDFLDESGNVDLPKVDQYVNYIKEYQPKQWQYFKQQFMPLILKRTYYQLLDMGLSSRSYLEDIKVPQNAELDMAYAPYKDVIQKPSEALKRYLKDIKHPAVESETADIQYVFFKEEASTKDRKDIQEELNDLVTEFKSSPDLEDFIDTYSDTPFKDSYVYESSLSKNFKRQITKLSTGKFTEIYEEDNLYKISKLIKKRSLPDSVKARHIFISYENQKRKNAKKLADSLFTEVQKNPKTFASICKDYSDDTYTKNNGGDLGYQIYQNLQQTFKASLFEHEKDLTLVESSNGFHIIKIDKRKGKSKAYKLATLSRSILPSEETIEEVYKNVVQFEEALTPTTFTNLAKTKGLKVLSAKGLTKVDEKISGLGPQRQIVKWIYSDKDPQVGDIERFELSSGYVIAQITSKKEAGEPNMDLVSRDLLLSFSKENLYHDAIKNLKESTQSKESFSKSNRWKFDPKVVGVLTSLSPKKTSHNIAGKDGVFKITITKRDQNTQDFNFFQYQEPTYITAYKALRKEGEETNYLHNFF